MTRRPILEKAALWRDSNKGLKSRLNTSVRDPAADRDDLSTLRVQQKIDRSRAGQRARLKFYPSIDVEKDPLYAGTLQGDREEVVGVLQDLGFRSNPTAYVEVTEEDGPDEGSFSRQVVTESGGGLDLPAVGGFPQIYKRVKEQIHVCIFKQEGLQWDILAHRERSAWLQPMRHVVVNNSDARRGVRDFRNVYFDTLGSELDGKGDIKWETVH